MTDAVSQIYPNVPVKHVRAVEIYNGLEPSREGAAFNGQKFLAWLNMMAKACPEEFASTLEIKLVPEADREAGDYVWIKITYIRPMTPGEINDADEREWKRENLRRSLKQREFDRLATELGYHIVKPKPEQGN